jgi:hypothetical protein
MPPPIRPLSFDTLDIAPRRDVSLAEHARVVLVVNDPIRRGRMLDVIRDTAPQCQVEVVSDVLDGMARSTSMPTHLLVLDASVDRLVMAALVRYLARTAPGATVHVYDSLVGRTPDESLDNSEEPAAAADDSASERQALEIMREATLRWLSTLDPSAPVR